jgi:hypothetical protein
MGKGYFKEGGFKNIGVTKASFKVNNYAHIKLRDKSIINY